MKTYTVTENTPFKATIRDKNLYSPSFMGRVVATNKDNQETTFDRPARFYEYGAEFSVPSTYVTSANLPATLSLEVSKDFGKTFVQQGEVEIVLPPTDSSNTVGQLVPVYANVPISGIQAANENPGTPAVCTSDGDYLTQDSNSRFKIHSPGLYQISATGFFVVPEGYDGEERFSFSTDGQYAAYSFDLYVPKNVEGFQVVTGPNMTITVHENMQLNLDISPETVPGYGFIKVIKLISFPVQA